jgi:hypothetical protein
MYPLMPVTALIEQVFVETDPGTGLKYMSGRYPALGKIAGLKM